MMIPYMATFLTRSPTAKRLAFLLFGMTKEERSSYRNRQRLVSTIWAVNIRSRETCLTWGRPLFTCSWQKDRILTLLPPRTGEVAAG